MLYNKINITISSFKLKQNSKFSSRKIDNFKSFSICGICINI